MCLSGSMSNVNVDDRRLSGRKSTTVFMAFAAAFHTAKLNKYNSVFQLAVRNWQAVVLAVGSAGRLPAHFRTLSLRRRPLRANAQVRLVQHGSDDSTGGFKIADLRKAENEARTRAHEDIFGGDDKWGANRLPYDQRSSSLKLTSLRSTKRGLSFFDQHARKLPSSSMFLGRRIPGWFQGCPSFERCLNCSSERDTRRSDVKQEKKVCIDGIHTRKVPHRPSPSPSLFSITADRCPYLAGEQYSETPSHLRS